MVITITRCKITHLYPESPVCKRALLWSWFGGNYSHIAGTNNDIKMGDIHSNPSEIFSRLVNNDIHFKCLLKESVIFSLTSQFVKIIEALAQLWFKLNKLSYHLLKFKTKYTRY